MAGTQTDLRAPDAAGQGRRRGHGVGADRVRERRVDHHGRELAPPRRGRALLVRHRRCEGIGDDSAAAHLQGAARRGRGRHADGRNGARDAIHSVLPRRVDVFPGGDQGRRERAAATRSAGAAASARCDLSVCRRRTRRLAVRLRREVVLVALGAIAVTLSYPPFPLPILSFFAITPAVLLIRQSVVNANPREAFRWGWWYGLITNALVLYWMVVALWHFTPLSALGYLATIAIIGLLTGVMFWFVVRIRLAAPAVPLWVVLPVAWTTLEWLIGHLGDIRFPWLGLGTSLADAPVLIQWADIAGARGVTLWVAWANVMMVEAALDVRRMPYAVRRFGAVLGTVALALGYGVWRMKTLPVRDVGVIGMIQPNEGFSEKWNPRHADSAMSTLLSLSRELIARQPRPQLLVWPEAAVPGYFLDHPQWERVISGLVRENDVQLLTGGLNAEPQPPPARGFRIYNAVDRKST